MGGAFLAYYADYVLGAGGAPVAGASVGAYATSQFAPGTLPSGGAPGVAAVASATTDASGAFVFPGLPPDDYHLLIVATPPGGSPVVAWRYFVPVVAAEAVRRGLAAPRAACLPRTLARLAAGADVAIFCLGDDTTAGYNATGTTAGGWVALLAVALGRAYPDAAVLRADPAGVGVTMDGPIPGWSTGTVQSGSASNGPLQTITVVNAGVRGDTVLRALRRFANLTASWPETDCVIVGLGQAESVAADPQRYVPPPDFASHLESLVNIVRTATAAELLLCTPHANPAAANVDAYAEAVRSVAARTCCDLADLRQLWLDRYVAGGPNDGYDPWLDSAASRLFPTDAGHAAIAAELARHFMPSLALPYAGLAAGAGASYETVRVPFSSNQVLLTGSGWTPHGGYQGAWLNSSGGSLEMVTSHPGDSLTISGRFVDLAMLCRRWTDGGQIGVSVDSGPRRTVDLYRGYPASTSDLSDANGAAAPQDRVLLAHGLSDGLHTVELTLLASQNPASAGTVWRLESLELGRQRRHGYQVECADAQSRLQSGAAAVPVAGASAGSLLLSFDQPFTGQGNLPVVVATCQNSAYTCAASAISASGFNLQVVRRDGATVTETPVCCWMAFG